MIGFPNPDAVERHLQGKPVYALPETNIPAPPQQRQYISHATAPNIETPPNTQSKESATIMLSDKQFERLLETTINQQPAPVPLGQLVSIAPPNSELIDNRVTEFGNNVADLVGNITFGTVNRAGKTITTLVNNMIDIITFGYGMSK